MEKKAKAPRVISDTTLDRYLGAILALRQRIPIVRSVDVANHLGNSKACVSMAPSRASAAPPATATAAIIFNGCWSSPAWWSPKPGPRPPPSPAPSAARPSKRCRAI